MSHSISPSRLARQSRNTSHSYLMMTAQDLSGTNWKWLLSVAEGNSEPTLLEVAGCEGTWMWLEGARHSPQYSTYVVRTDVAK